MVFDVGDTGDEPLIAFEPVHPFDAVHDDASVEDHVRVADCPDVTEVGLTESDTVGAGVAGDETDTLVDCEPEPPEPVHESVYVASDAGETDCEPLVPFVTVQLPDAVHDDASVDDQVIVADCPDVMDEGLADKVTVGAAGVGGGDPTAPTVTVAEELPEPPAPVHESV